MNQHTLLQSVPVNQSDPLYGEQSEPKSFYQLFQLAFDHQDEQAWLLLQSKYTSLLFNWIYQFSPHNLTQCEAEEILQDALARFWRCLSAHSRPLRSRFPHIGAVMKYLRQCILSSCLDYHRRQHQLNKLDEKLIAEAETAVLHMPISYDEEGELIELVRHWLHHHVDDPLERLLIKLTFEDDLKPREIVVAYPLKYPRVIDVYRMKERILKRARRAFVGSRQYGRLSNQFVT